MEGVTQKTASATIDQAELAAHLRLSVTRLSRRLRQESTTGLTPSLISALSTVYNHGPLPIGVLADHERVAPPSITKVVSKLEADGLVERQADLSDKRVTHVAITKAGRDLVQEIRRRKTTWLTARVNELSPDDQARLAAAVEILEHLATHETQP